jgi:ribosomal protein S18 acetylase RimI-like enzyme
MVRLHRLEPGPAARQSGWIVAMEPWRSLGYRTAPLGRYLRRMARARCVLAARDKSEILALAVVQPDFLLGQFIALLAVRPEAGGKGIGRALVARIERDTFRSRKWLYVSSDATNDAAARFYRKLGFRRVARLPGLVRDDRSEILWRKRRPAEG